MRIIFTELGSEGRRYVGTEPSSILELRPEDGISVDQPLHYDLVAVRVRRRVLVTGTLSGQARLLCVRCAQPFEMTLAEPNFDREYDLDGPGVPWGDPENSIDLTPDLREAMLLRLPSHPVCRPDCQGLCPRCGADWNRGLCKCQPEPDPRWGPLDRLAND